MKIPFWKRPFLYLSGTDFKTISQCPSDNATRYSILGGLVCIPAIVGFCSSYYAISLVFQNTKYSIFIALVWAFVILTIDRCIIAHNPQIFDNDDIENGINKKRERINSMIFSRFAISLVLSFVVAEPICVSIFQDEIKEQIFNDKLNEGNEKAKFFEGKIEKSEQIIEAKRKEWLAKQDSATAEGDGSGGSRKPNLGPKFKQKQSVADTLKSEYQITKGIEERNIDSFKNEIVKLKNSIDTVKASRLLGQINALNKKASVDKEYTLTISIWAIRFLFICIELIPLILKSSLKRKSDAYVVMCHQNNKIAIAYNEEEENNSTKKEMIAASLEENKDLDQILRTKDIERAAKDFKFFFSLNQNTAKLYEESTTKLEKIITDEVLRLQVLNNLINAYQDFLAKTITTYTSKDSVNEED